jgi:hypothetical protein
VSQCDQTDQAETSELPEFMELKIEFLTTTCVGSRGAANSFYHLHEVDGDSDVGVKLIRESLRASPIGLSSALFGSDRSGRSLGIGEV